MSDLPACCTDLDIAVLDLMLPERLTPRGAEFMAAHGLDDLTLDERHALLAGADDLGAGVVKLKHRCRQLEDDGRCAIYEDRPAICRAFDCALRSDCACGGSGVIA